MVVGKVSCHRIFDGAMKYDELFLVYSRFVGLEDGDKYNPLDYVRWLNAMKAEFAQWDEIPLTKPFNTAEQRNFEKYLNTILELKLKREGRA